MADAASKHDEIARLTPKGAIFLKNGAGSGPAINSAGEIIDEVPTYNSAGEARGFERKQQAFGEIAWLAESAKL